MSLYKLSQGEVEGVPVPQLLGPCSGLLKVFQAHGGVVFVIKQAYVEVQSTPHL